MIAGDDNCVLSYTNRFLNKDDYRIGLNLHGSPYLLSRLNNFSPRQSQRGPMLLMKLQLNLLFYMESQGRNLMD